MFGLQRGVQSQLLGLFERELALCLLKVWRKSRAERNCVGTVSLFRLDDVFLLFYFFCVLRFARSCTFEG